MASKSRANDAQSLIEKYENGAFTQEELFVRLAGMVTADNADEVLSAVPGVLLPALDEWINQRGRTPGTSGLSEGTVLGAGLSRHDALELEKKLESSVPLIANWLRRVLPPAPIPVEVPGDGHAAEPSPSRKTMALFVRDALANTPEAARQRGKVPLFDQAHDARYEALPTFQPALSALTSLELFRRHYGADAANSQVLQFLYRYIDALPEHQWVWDQGAFDRTWALFWNELNVAHWTHSGVTILQQFSAPFVSAEIADGLWICQRSTEGSGGKLQEYVLERLRQDWMQGVIGLFVLLAEHVVFKTPQSSGYYLDSFHPSVKLFRGLLALRLLHGGDVSTGRFHYFRSALFPAQLPGGSYGGTNLWMVRVFRAPNRNNGLP
jgi:hypothetical protein